MPQQLASGNIDLSNRPRVKNADGTISTVRSISINEDGNEVLIPTVSDDGRILSNADAIALYHKTGKHLGIFSSVASANAAAKSIHESEAGKLMADPIGYDVNGNPIYAGAAAATPPPTTNTDPLAGLEPKDKAADGQGGWLDAMRNFGSHFAQTTVAPVADFLQHGLMNPTYIVNMGKQMLDAHKEQFAKSKAAYQQGRLSEAAGHFLAGSLPLVGPTAAHAGEEIADAKWGDWNAYAGAAGDVAGILLPFGVHPALKFAGEAADAASGVAADVADRMATNKVVKVIAPKGGPNRLQLTAMARKVAPAIARDPALSAWSEAGLQDKLEIAHDSARAAMNASYDAVPDSDTFELKPIKDSLRKSIDDLTVKGYRRVKVAGDQSDLPDSVRPSAIATSDQTAANPPVTLPTGEKVASGVPTEVEPATREARIGALSQSLQEVNRLGDTANIDNLRSLAQAWGIGAKKIYTSAVAPDYFTAKGTGLGYADAEQAVRDHIANVHPEIKPLNAKYSLYRSGKDLMQATQEFEDAKGVGLLRSAKSYAAGAAVGEGVGQYMGMPPTVSAVAGGAVLGPILDAASASGITSQVGVARALARAADALRAGKTARAQSAIMSAAQTVGAKVPPTAMQAFTNWMTQPAGAAIRKGFGAMREAATDTEGSMPRSPKTIQVHNWDEVGNEVTPTDIPMSAAELQGTPEQVARRIDRKFTQSVEPDYAYGAAGNDNGIWSGGDRREYPGNPKVTQLPDGTVVVEGKFGRDKNAKFAFNPIDPSRAADVMNRAHEWSQDNEGEHVPESVLRGPGGPK